MTKFVDVSSCEWFRQIDLDTNIICTLNSIKKRSGYCKDNPNCVFKQLKRKEQECMELKKQVEIFTRQLEKANKEVIKEKEKNATQRQKNEKLEQTLTEIKEIAKSFCSACQEFEPEKIDRNCMYCNYGKILQKIKEYEVK